MKKFLFTLASLFIASSAFANSYFYMEKPEITEDMVGQELTLIVGADFQEYVSAFELWITMPEGLEIVDFEAGADMKGLKYYNQRGREQSLDASVTTLDMQHFVGITSAAATGYYQLEDESWAPYGAIKWEPGVYEEMIILYVEVSAVPAEDVMLYTEPGCGADPRTDNLATTTNGANIPWGVVPGDEPVKEDCESPSVMGATGENGTYYIQITPDPATDGALQYTVDVEPVSTETIDGIVYLYYNRGAEDVTVHVEAWTEEGANYNASEKEIKDIVVPKLDQVKTPTVSFVVNDDNTITITASCETEGATVVLYDPNGNAVANPTTVSYDPYEGYDATWTAKATAPYMLPSEEGSNHIVIAADEKADVDSPSIMGYPDEDGVHYIIMITPDPATDGALEYTADPAPGAKATELVYTRGEEPYVVHVEAWTKEGPTCKASEKEIKDITVPALDQVKTPEITWTMGDEPNTFVVSATCLTEGATVTLYDPEGNATFNPVTVTYDPEEGYNGTWTAKATKENMLDSEVASKLIEIAPEHQPVIYYVDDPVIGEPTVNDENVTVVVTGEGHIVVTVTMGTETLNFEGDEVVNVVIPRGEEDDFAIINAVATVDPVPAGYDEVQPGRATSDLIDIPALPEQTAAPTITNKDGKSEWDTEGNLTYDGHYTTVTITNNDEEDVVIYWSYDGVTYQPYTGPWNITEDGDYVIYAYAQAEGRPASEVVSWAVHVTPATGVVELVNGKAVAGVRYFNMAGQEMKEANGVTIVVTTYTDGTTSAVKVIK